MILFSIISRTAANVKQIRCPVIRMQAAQKEIKKKHEDVSIFVLATNPVDYDTRDDCARLRNQETFSAPHGCEKHTALQTGQSAAFAFSL